MDITYTMNNSVSEGFSSRLRYFRKMERNLSFLYFGEYFILLSNHIYDKIYIKEFLSDFRSKFPFKIIRF